MDLSNISTEDLKAMQAGDLSKVSTEGLKAMQAYHVEPTATPKVQPGKLASFGAGAGLEFGNIVLGGQKLLGKGVGAVDEFMNGKDLSSLVTGRPSTTLGRTGQWLVNDAEQGQAKLKAENDPYAQANPLTNKSGRFATDLVVTAPVGGLLAGGARTLAPGLAATKTGANFLTAVQSGGMSGGGLLTRAGGGAVTGGASAAVVDPSSAGPGAVIGALTPAFFKAVGLTGDAFAGLVRPFFASGQEKIVADVLKRYANNPQAAVAALRQAREIVPGSAPTTAAAAGDAGLSGLTRTLQNASPDFAADMANRTTSQNTARTAMLESMAGNTGRIAVAKESRDAATGAMRESVLERAGALDAQGILKRIDALIKNPNNAGETAQAALKRMRAQVEGSSANGQINARALYEIRKDAGLAMNGKLQGDASNLRYARSVLSDVQGVFDDAIDQASQRAVPNAFQAGPGLTTASQANKLRAADKTEPVASWKSYLSKYADMSKPINQMEALEDILKRTQTGATDAQGNLVLSAAKLNNILKNESGELTKILTKEQLQNLRNLAADMNASQLAMNSGKSTGSNTVQNLSNDQLLTSLMGRLGGTTPAKTTLGNLLKVPYIRANQDIQQRLGNALMSPGTAADLIERASRPANPLAPRSVAGLAYRVPPLLPATDR